MQLVKGETGMWAQVFRSPGPSQPSPCLAVSQSPPLQPDSPSFTSLGTRVFLFRLKLLPLAAASHSKTRDSYSLQSEPQVFPGWLCQLFSSNCFWGRGNPHINGIPKKNVMVTKQGESSDNRRKCWKIPFHLTTAVWGLDMSTPGNRIRGQRFPPPPQEEPTFCECRVTLPSVF